MKFSDMLQTGAANLWKRKFRSALTIMGVVIGVASIVVMVSLGLGLSASMMEEYSSYGSITQITVQTPYADSGSGTNTDELRLNAALVEDFKNIEHVESVYPVLQTSIISIYGGYTGYLQLKATTLEGLESFGIEVGEGRLPDETDDELTFFYGNSVLMDFANAKTGQDYWSTGVTPDIDLMGGALFTVFDTNSYYSAQSGSGQGSGEGGSNDVKPPKKYLIPACGIQKETEGYDQNGWYVFCDIDQLIPKLKQIFKKSVIPGQPSTKSGKPFNEIFYTQILVNADDMENVSAIQKQIEDMGYTAYSNAEWISSAMTSMGYVQAVLGGIGAVSLLVAAIGITNTMMMSIYERTKEIGVMKVLGCALENIRMMFLIEAGIIGFIGGVVGVLLSYAVSAIINYVSAGSDVMGLGISAADLSRIPPWLALLSVIFAIVIAMIAGFFPSQKAMRLSPLAAIRNE
ncbi:MAG: ABC transporter permease [Lachnospiraceae bacterium]|nr:ABC transporter permease [Lachnospiraceae bacterium]